MLSVGNAVWLRFPVRPTLFSAQRLYHQLKMPGTIGVAICLFRNDLRVHDNSVLLEATKNHDHVLPVFCFDPRQHGSAATTYYHGLSKIGPHRYRFLVESVGDLAASLQQLGSRLVVREGRPEDVLSELAAQIKNVAAVYLHQEVASEETDVEAALKRRCGVPVKLLWGSTMYHLQDLPFKPSQLPNTYSQFRVRMEAGVRVRPSEPRPTALKPLPPLPSGFDFGAIPAVSSEVVEPQRSAFPFRGGETAALERLHEYFWQTDSLATYKDTRNGLVGTNYSSKFSPWLALGCISPRYIYAEIGRYEKQRVANKSTYWLFFEMLWRDYFHFLQMKVGNTMFHLGGPRHVSKKWIKNDVFFKAWAEGNTGLPFVDANMRELTATGWQSNRGRQNVASFLAKDLELDWRIGAEYFEQMLLDHDVSSNYGNWTYVAGVGTDPREDRHFNVVKQGKDYDPDGEYVRMWCPELKNVPTDKIHHPWTMTASEQKRFGVLIGKDYPAPIVMRPEWARHFSNRSGSDGPKNRAGSSKGNGNYKGYQLPDRLVKPQSTIDTYFKKA